MSLKRRVNTYTVSALCCTVAAFGAEPSREPDLKAVRRVCVDVLAGDAVIVAPAREIAMASIFSLKRFTVTENCAKADAVLRGAVIERREKKIRGEGESGEFGAAAGGLSGSRNAVAAGIAAVAGGSSENLYSAETGSHASVTLRLVSADGDVLWAYTQDSTGGKTRGAIADAVDRAIRQLGRDLTRPATDREIQ